MTDMPIRREMPAGDWPAFLRDFNGRNYARPVRLETVAPSGRMEWLLAEHQPLLGVELDLKGSEAPAVTVALGGLEHAAPQFTHVITEPVRLWVEEEVRGLTLRLIIESKEDGQTRLIFERSHA
jgi:hypothetical protein